MVNSFNPFEDSNKKTKANKREKKVSKSFGASQRGASGAFAGYKGDFVTKDFMFDLKSTQYNSTKLELKDLRKLQVEAVQDNKDPVLVIDFENARNLENEYCVIPKSVFIELVERGNNE